MEIDGSDAYESFITSISEHYTLDRIWLSVRPEVQEAWHRVAADMYQHGWTDGHNQGRAEGEAQGYDAGLNDGASIGI